MKPSAYRLLMIDDDPDLLDTLMYIVREEGYQATPASSLAEALALIETQTFDLIVTDLLDYNLAKPGKHIQALIDRAQPTPIGIMTGHRLLDEHPFPEARFILPKPFDLQDFFGQIAAALTQPVHA